MRCNVGLSILWWRQLRSPVLKHAQQIQATERAFAAILADRSVITWGHPEYGGDSCQVENPLRNVWQIQSTAGSICCDPFWWIGCYLRRSIFWLWWISTNPKINSQVGTKFDQLCLCELCEHLFRSDLRSIALYSAHALQLAWKKEGGGTLCQAKL